MKSSSYKDLLRKILATLLFITILVAAGTFLAFHYDEIGYFFTVLIIISLGLFFLPKFLRKNFDTDKNNFIESYYGYDYLVGMGSFLWTMPNDQGLYPYRQFKMKLISGDEQLKGKVYYIDFKAKLLILFSQILELVVFVFIWISIHGIKEPIIEILILIFLLIFFFIFSNEIRNLIIKKTSKNII